MHLLTGLWLYALNVYQYHMKLYQCQYLRGVIGYYNTYYENEYLNVMMFHGVGMGTMYMRNV